MSRTARRRRLKGHESRRGLRRDQARDRQPAVELLAVEPPGVATCDFVTPRGWTATRVAGPPAPLLSGLKDLSCILVTALSDPNDVIRGVEAEASTFIRTPHDRPV